MLASKQKRKMFGVLGISQIEDEVGSQAYYFGKDMQKTRPFGLKEIFPNLYQDYDRDKRGFELLMSKMEKKIKTGEEDLSLLQKSQGSSGKDQMQRQGSVGSAQHFSRLSRQRGKGSNEESTSHSGQYSDQMGAGSFKRKGGKSQ